VKAADVMVTNVISVSPDASVQDVARVLLNARISAVPVVDQDGKLLGIVSEGDLMRRAEAGTGRERSWWAAFIPQKKRPAAKKELLATKFVKEHSRKVTDVMTRDVVTAAHDTPLSTIASLLEKNAIKRVPIVRKSKVAGIVSRANLLQALANPGRQAEVATPLSDKKIRKKVLAQLNAESWTTSSSINVIVQDGTVQLWGTVASASEKKAVRVAAEVTPGVRAVDDNLVIRPAKPDEPFVPPAAPYDSGGLIIGIVAGVLILIAGMMLFGMRI
jgi:CBS-domain-containing membrane protein